MGTRYQEQPLLEKVWRQRFVGVALMQMLTVFLQPHFWQIYQSNKRLTSSVCLYRSVCMAVAHRKMGWTYSKQELLRQLKA